MAPFFDFRSSLFRICKIGVMGIILNQSILRDGLMIISSCKKETGDIWQAHIGAAAIGSYFFVKSNNLSRRTGSIGNFAG